MKAYGLALLPLLTVFVGARVEAQSSPVCQPGGTVIAFGNGMRNDIADAEDSLIALSTMHDPSQLDPDGNVQYILAYNSKESLWLELLEVARQKVLDDPAGVWRFLSGDEPPEWFTVFETEQAKKVEALAAFLIDEDLQRQVSDYLLHLAMGQRVLVVSHSQGNFYANSAALLLPAPYRSSWGNTQVATPVETVESGGPSVRFVIGRDGSISNVGNAGSDLPDSGVVSCILSAFYGLSFPQPEGGIVTVVYPILFAPD